jgi:hypothetical protein
MKMEMDGREPLVVIFGVPLLTAGIVLGSIYFGQMHVQIVPPPAISVEPKINVTPRVSAELPPGGIRNIIEVPPAQIHEVIKEVVKVPDVSIINKVDPAPPPTVQVNVPKPDPTEPRVVVVPTPVPMPMPTPTSMEPEKEKEDGKLLPPPHKSATGGQPAPK